MKNNSTFKNLNFADIFETLDDEYLILLSQNDPEQLKRLCMYLSLDEQIRKEKLENPPKFEIN